MSKFFDIKTRIVLDPASTSKAVQEFSKHLTAIQKTGAFANMATDLKKVEPMLKNINKEALGLSKSFVEAFKKERLQEVNKALAEQNERFKSNAQELIKMKNAYDQMSKGALKDAARVRMSGKASEQSMLMNGMQDLMQTRDADKAARAQKNAERIRSITGFAELAHESMVATVGKRSYEGSYSLGARAQAQEPSNQLIGQFLSNPLVGANIARAMKKEKVIETSFSTAQGRATIATLDAVQKPLIAAGSSAGDSMMGFAEKLASGQGPGAALEAIKGAGKAALAGGSEMLNQYMGDNHYLHNPRTEGVTKDAMTGQAVSEDMGSVAVLQQVRNQLLQNFSSHIPTLMAASESSGGGFGQAYGNMKTGAARGFRVGETAALQQSTYHNFTGGERDSTGTFQGLQRAGIGNASSLAGAAGGLAMATQSNQVKEFEKIITEGFVKGIDKSKLIDFAAGVTDIASSMNNFVKDTSGATKMMMQALGTSDLKNVNRGEMAAARGALGAERAIDQSEIGMAQKMTDINAFLGEDSSKLDPRVLASLASAQDISDLSPAAKRQIESSLGKDQANKLFKNFDKIGAGSTAKTLSTGGLTSYNSSDNLTSSNQQTRDLEQIGIDLSLGGGKEGTAFANRQVGRATGKAGKNVNKASGLLNGKNSAMVNAAAVEGASIDVTALNQSLVKDKENTLLSIDKSKTMRAAAEEKGLTGEGLTSLADISGIPKADKLSTSYGDAASAGAKAVAETGGDLYKMASDKLGTVTDKVSSALDKLSEAINSKVSEFRNMKMGAR